MSSAEVSGHSTTVCAPTSGLALCHIPREQHAFGELALCWHTAGGQAIPDG